MLSETWMQRIRRWTLPVAMVAMLAALVIVPRVFGPAASITAGFLVALPAVVLAALTGAPLTAPTARVLAACASAVGLLAVSAALSDNVAVSLGGLIEARTGWAMWALGLVWLWIAVALGSRSGLKRLAATIAVIGVVMTLAAAADAIGIVRNAVGWSVKPAGVFENALSLGQFLVLALGCALAWTAVATHRWERVVGWTSTVACIAGIVLTSSRGAMLGALTGLLFVIAVSAIPAIPRAGRIGAGVVLGVGIAAGAGALSIAGLGMSQPLAGVVDTLLTGRLTLWHAALVEFAQDPLIGAGPGMFSAFARWAQTPQGTLDIQWANDPHSVGLYWLAGGGVIGFAAFVFAMSMLLLRLVAISRRSMALSALTLGVTGWFASTLFTWTNPYALIACAMVVGAMLGARDEAVSAPVTPAWTRWTATSVAAVLIVVVGVTVLPGLSDEYQWAALRESGEVGQMALAQEAVERSPDPSYATWLLTNGLPQAVAQKQIDAAIALDDASALLRRYDTDTGWYAPLALASIETAFRGRGAGRVSVDELERTIVAARAADPGSGCFDFVAADRFAQLGMERRAQAHARTALGHPLSPDIRQRLERFTAPDDAMP